MPENELLVQRLSAISATIAEGLPRKAVFERILESVQKLGFDRVRLDLLSADGALLEPAASRGYTGSGPSVPVQASEDTDLKQLRAQSQPQIMPCGCADPESCSKTCPGPHGCVPVLLRKEVVGKICVDNAYTRKSLDLERLQDALALAHHAALAQITLSHDRLRGNGGDGRLTVLDWPENARLSADSLEALRQTTLAITSKRGRDDLLKIIVEQSVKLLKAKSGGLYEYQAERGGLVLLAEFNRPEHIGGVVKRGEGMAGRLFFSRETHMVVENYSRWEGQAPTFAGKDIFGAVLEVPLHWKEREIGVLYVDDEVGREYTEADIRLLRLFADQATISLINSTLLAKDEKKLKRLEQVAKANGEMMGNLDAISLPDRLAMIARKAADILGAETSGVFRAHDQHLVLEASFGHRELFGPEQMLPLRIHDEEGGGLTGYIAYHRKLFKDHGESLKAHLAVAHSEPHAPSGDCYSLLAIPLLKRVGQVEELIGLLRADNKKGEDGKALATLGFTQEDEWILTIFAEAAVVAMEGAELVSRLTEQGAFRERLISSSPNGIIAVDGLGRVTEFNKRAEEILGYSREEILGQPVNSLYFDPKEPSHIGKMLHLNPDHHVRDYETFVRSKSEEKIPILHASTWLFNAQEERTGSVGYFEDLRPRKSLERRESLLLRASNVLVQAESLDSGLQRLTEMMVSALGRSFCGILLMDEDGTSLTLKGECVKGAPGWRPQSQQIVLADWKGLPELLKRGKSWTQEWRNQAGQLVLKKLNNLLGFERDIEMLLAVPLKIGDRVVGQLDYGDLQGEGQSKFTKEEIGLVSAIAAQVTVLIDRFQLLEMKQRREKLLEALVEASRHLRAEVEIPSLQQVVVRLAAVELARCRVGALFLNRSHLGQLELAAVYGLPESLVGKRLSHEDGVVGRVAQDGDTAVVRDLREEDFFRSLDLRIVAALPFRSAAGEVEAVLCLGDPAGQGLFGPTDIEILKAFATQATIALRTARLMDREQLYFSQLATLHSISDYIQEQIQEAQTLEEILHPVLTGVTASYGLGFNRAILMLVDEAREDLVGELGIGEIEEEEARAAWESDTSSGLNDFDLYLRRLKQREIPSTKVGLKTKHLRLSLGGADVFSEVVAQSKLRRVGVKKLDRVPTLFRETFQVSTPLAIAPLVAKSQVIGLLVVDNKFTQAPIGDGACDALMTFAATAAVAIDNKRLLEQTRSGAATLRSFYELSSQLTALQDPKEILKRIVDQTVTTAEASWVSILLIDEKGRALNPIQSGRRFSLDHRDPVPIRPDGISMEVMRTGRAVTIENVEKMRHLINNDLIEKSVRAALCLPMSLPGRRIGVVWVHYETPRRFSDPEVLALQLYVNQAAIAYESARRLEGLEDLQEVSRALFEANDPADVLTQIVQGAKQVLKADTVVLWYYDSQTDDFIPELSVHSGEHPAAWSVLQTNGPQRQGTAFRIMEQDWVGIPDVRELPDDGRLGPNTRRFLAEVGARDFQGIALKLGKERLGVLYAIYTKPCQFDDAEREAAQRFASPAALALKKAKLYEQVHRARETAEAVAKVTLLEDQGHTLISIARAVREALDAGAVVLCKYDPEKGKLVLPPVMAGGILSAEHTADYSLVLAMLEQKRPYIVPDVSNNEMYRDSPFIRAQGIKSCVAIPLIAADRKVGVLFVNYWNHRRFAADEIAVIQMFANQAALAIRNGQLFEDRSVKLSQQKALADLSRELLVAKTVQEAMDRAVEFAAKALDTELGNIVQSNRDGRLIFSAGFGWPQHLIGKLMLRPGTGSQTGYTIQERQPVAVEDYHNIPFQVPKLVFKQRIESGLSVPMFRNEEIVGSMLVHTRRRRRFTPEDETLLSLIANQTAVALERLRQYEASERKGAYLAALNKASKEITAGFGMERRQILEKIVQPAMEGIVGIYGPKAVLGVVQLYDEERDELVLESVYPPEKQEELAVRIGERRSLRARLKGKERIGVTGRTVLTGHAQLVESVKKDLDYIVYTPETRSELAVPLIDRDHNKVIGVLNVESDRLSAFDSEDKEALQTLAELAVMAIQNARQVQELRTQTNLAWMGRGNAIQRHDMASSVGKLQNDLYLLRKDLEKLGIPQGQFDPHIKRIKATLKRDFNVEKLPTGRADENLTSIRVHDIVHSWRKRIPLRRSNKTLLLKKENLVDESATIRCNLQWLQRALEFLLNNAMDATEGISPREIILGSRRRESRAEISVSDNGRGIPEEITEKLLREPIPGSKGMGRGLLIAKAIVQSWGGTIRWEPRQPQGITMIVSLPLELIAGQETRG